MIKININKYSYENKIPVIKNINISLKEGQITTLIGASGCGKSTLLRVLMGMETGAHGNIFYNQNEFNFNHWNSKQTLFSMVPQTPLLFPWKNIIENIKLAISKKKEIQENKTKNEIALNALKIVQMDEHALKFPDEISLGMAQRVAFARALVLDTKAILLDEPFASLDAHTRRILQEWLLLKIKETSKYAILVTHDVREALLLSKEINVLSGVPAEVYKTYTSDDILHENKNLEEDILSILGRNIN
ncbi:ABC transporter ATP-binding protein [Fluviispira multicolorata]|uniref:ATP-binding cassette domain-containing protein n=1 Tax=Fluviispira multicolorata TaxID=2654512 RepID=A0A833JC92_9BACT|nr:ABC transporter ATP-binding protein [Fluviispira multicolorata]KAB8029998.1 ATP-binding cassette domain-containing protein [Fluviispira multicolorata]